VRRVASITELTGMEGLTPQTQELFRFDRRGRRGRTIQGEFVATGIVPRLVEELREQEVELPMKLFEKSRGEVRP
jgi:pilus assembly protein CpaF